MWGVGVMLLGVLGWYVLNAMRPMDNPATQDSIGYSYQTGRGGEQDYAKAREWYEKAAVHGEVHAQYIIGSLYRKGLGVSKITQKIQPAP